MSNSSLRLESKKYRKTIISVSKRIIAATSDTAADWFFAFSVYDDEDDNIDKYRVPLYAFAIFSAVTYIFGLYIGLMRLCQRSDMVIVKRRRWMERVELFFEDIPQFVLTSLIAAERGKLTGFSVFNLATSALNFLFGLLDILEDVLLLENGEDFPYL